MLDSVYDTTSKCFNSFAKEKTSQRQGWILKEKVSYQQTGLVSLGGDVNDSRLNQAGKFRAA